MIQELRSRRRGRGKPPGEATRARKHGAPTSSASKVDRPLSDVAFPKRGLTNPFSLTFQVSRVTVRAKAAVEAAGGSIRRVHYNKLGFKALLKREWFEKKGRLLPRPACPPPKQADKVDSIGCLATPIEPILFTFNETVAAARP